MENKIHKENKVHKENKIQNEFIPFARPFIGREEEQAALRVLRSGWLTTGAEALAFENEFAQFLSVAQKPLPLCLAVNSATSGLHLALEACGVGRGDKVLVPSCTFAATAEAVRYLDADPVFVDTCPGAFNMDPDSLEKAVQRLLPQKAKAVIPVHFGGLPCNMDAIMEIACRYGLKVIEDAAHAFPAFAAKKENGNKPPVFAGTVGDIGVFSFYATKTITTGEGGMVVCRDRAIAKRISLMRLHGIDRTVWNRYTSANAAWYYQVVEAGFKYNLPDILAAIGRVQLSRAWKLLEMRKEIANAYDSAFANDECFIIPPTGPGDARHLYPLRIQFKKLKMQRDAFIESLKKAGIGVSVHFIPLHTMPYYKKRYRLKINDFPQTVKSCSQEISLPIWPGMKKNQVNKVIDVVQSVAKSYTH